MDYRFLPSASEWIYKLSKKYLEFMSKFHLKILSCENVFSMNARDVSANKSLAMQRNDKTNIKMNLSKV